MDLFEKIGKNQNYQMSQAARAAGAYPYFHELRSGQDTVVDMEGRRTIMLGSNNYLGLTSHPKVKAAGIAALEKYGSGCSGSRFLNGTLDIHAQLERELAAFLHKDGAVTFGTGFQSNLGILGTIASLGDVILCDKENHASIYDGCKLSYAKMVRYEHSDMADLERRLKAVPESAGILIVTDGVFSMSGDICKLPEIVALAKKYGARVMVDDAHGLGVLGGSGYPHGHLFQVARQHRRVYGGAGGRRRVCPRQFPSLHFQRQYDACRRLLRPRRAGDPARGAAARGAPCTARRIHAPKAQRGGREHHRKRNADHPHLYV